MKYTRIYTDANGESHFEGVEVQFQEVDFAPPAPPLNLSSFNPAAQYGFVTFPADRYHEWQDSWHPTPQRQIFFVLSGVGELEVSDGEVRRFEPGSVVLLEDTTGKGHRNRAVSIDDVVTAVVQLPA
jgi:mannose-6-phosphate isomerase-like protein (cupin superfamily)